MNIDVIVRNQNNDKTGGEENEKNPWYCFSYNRNYSSIIWYCVKAKRKYSQYLLLAVQIGPTSIYVAGKISNIPVTISVVLGIVLLVIGVFVMIRNYKKK